MTKGQTYPFDAPYVPTPIDVVRAMLHVAELQPDDVVIDLGCGDGRIVIEAARLYGVRAIGVDLDEGLLACARSSARTAGVEHLVSFRCNDLVTTDIGEATVVMLYMLTEVNLRLRSRLLAMPEGTRIVAHRFGMGEWDPERFWMLGTSPILRWRVPTPEMMPVFEGGAERREWNVDDLGDSSFLSRSMNRELQPPYITPQGEDQ